MPEKFLEDSITQEKGPAPTPISPQQKKEELQVAPAPSPKQEPPDSDGLEGPAAGGGEGLDGPAYQLAPEVKQKIRELTVKPVSVPEERPGPQTATIPHMESDGGGTSQPHQLVSSNPTLEGPGHQLVPEHKTGPGPNKKKG